jgi:hypothetical protein
MNLAESAETQHIHPQTAYRSFRAGNAGFESPRVV